LKRIGIGGPALAFICATLLAAPASGRSELFRSLSFEASGGIMLPQGNLDEVLEPAPSGTARVSTTYYHAFHAHAFLAYAAVEAAGMSLSFQAVGLGLEWAGLPAWLPRPLAGVAMYAARLPISEDPENRFPLLHGGESEFGAYPGLRWEWAVGGAWSLSASARWDVIFTHPEPSHLLSLQWGAGWKWF
jgi:hypothetical protein